MTKNRGALERTEWERLWQEHWGRSALAGPEQEFLAEQRTPEAERARLDRIMEESTMGSSDCTTSGRP